MFPSSYKTKLLSMKTKKKNSVGLVLGSGGSKGFAHIGVIESLEGNGFSFDYITGSSVGALIAALYAKIGDIYQVKDIFLESGISTIAKGLLDFASAGGLVKSDRFGEFIKKHLGNTKFEDLNIPIAIVATDINTGEAVVLTEGSLVKAVLASIAVPPLIQPVRLEGRLLADGGLSDPLPVSAIRKLGAKKVIAVNLSNGYFKNKISLTSKTFDIGQRTIALSQIRLAELMAEDADVVISPKIDNQIILGLENMFNNKIIKSYAKAGKLATEEVLEDIRVVYN